MEQLCTLTIDTLLETFLGISPVRRVNYNRAKRSYLVSFINLASFY